MYEIVKRRGSFVKKLADAPSFATRDEAENWARDFMASHSKLFQIGLEAIEVRRILKGTETI